MQLNGFIIDQYNQYSFSENAKTSTCPLCSESRKKKTDKCVKLDWAKGLANCFHCGETLQMHTYKKRSEGKKEYKKPEWNNKTELPDNVVKWFETRGIKQTTLKIAQIASGAEWMPQPKKSVQTIQFPYFRFGEIVNIKYRTSEKGFKLAKDAELIFYNLDAIQYTDDCYIVEGEMDALALIQAGIHNVVSVPNGATLNRVNLEYLDNCIEYFENKESIYLCLDKDDAGQNLQQELTRRLGIERCFYFDLNSQKDANDYLLTYGGERLRQTLSQPIAFPLEHVVTMAEDGDLFDDYWIYGMPEGFKIGLKTFDETFSIDDEGRVMVVTGIPSHGKSEFVDQMVVGYNLRYDWKCAFCSVENQPVRLHKAKVFRKIYGCSPTGYDLKTEKYQATKQFLDENFLFTSFSDGIYDLNRVLDKAKELIFRKGIRVFVIDPYNKVRLKESLTKSITDYTNDYLLKLDQFAQKYRILIILVAHPKKMEKEATGKRAMPDFYDVKGGGEFYDMTPFGLVVHRDFENDRVTVKNLKVKFNHLGENQAETKFAYNTKNGRYSELTDMNEVIHDNESYLIFEAETQTQLEIPDNYEIIQPEEIPF